jgi:EmrB/QacA subfamily drug resistance transporter
VDRRINWLLLANAMLGSFLSGTASRIFNISLPTIAQSLGTDLVGISWAYLAYQLTNVGLSLVFGRVGDLYGKEKVFAIGFAVFAVSSFFCGLSQNVGQLIFSRMLQGVGGAMTQSVSRALASEAVPEELGGRAQGYMTTAFHTGFLLGPSFGGLIIDYIHWRWTFFVLVPIAAAGSALSLANVKRREEPEQKSPVDYTGAMLLIALSTLLVLVLDRRFVEVLGADARGLMGLAFVGCLAILFYHERRTPSPIVNFALFKIRMFSLSNLCLCVMAMCYIFIGFLLPFYLQEILHLSPSFIGFLFIVPAFLTILLSPLSGYLADKAGPRLPATAGVIFITCSLFIGTLFETHSSWLLPTLMLALSGVANGLFNTANSVGIINSVPRDDRGFASGALHLMFGIGNVSGIALASLLMTAGSRGAGQTGLAATSDPAGFVAALSATFLIAAGISVAALLTSAARGARIPRNSNAA